MADEDFFMSKEEKAAYNQSRGITEFLTNLLGSYIASMDLKKYDDALRAIERIVDIISAKIKEQELQEVDKLLIEIEIKLPMAMATYRKNGGIYWTNAMERDRVKRKIITLFRYVNKLQDKYGYGMVSLDDPRFAVLNR